MVRKALLCMLTLAACAVYSGCGDDENNPVASAPAMTGTWDVTRDHESAVDGFRFEIVEEKGVLSGRFVGPDESYVLHGACSESGVLSLYYYVSQLDTSLVAWGSFEGSANGRRTLLSGTFKAILLPYGIEVLKAPFTAAERGT